MTFSFGQCFTHFSEGTLNQNYFVYWKFNGKNRLSEGHPRFVSIFPSVNRQIKSVFKSLRLIQLMKKGFSEKYAFWGKKKSIFRNSESPSNFLV